MLYPAELRALTSAMQIKAFGSGKNSSASTSAVLPSDWLCSTSGTNVIEVAITRQQKNSKKFSYLKELRENLGFAFAPKLGHARMCALLSI
jgi:hypothetical protein